MDFLNLGKGVWLSIRFSSFLLNIVLYSKLTVETVRGCVSLKKYKSQIKAVEMTVIAMRKTLKTFVWISSKNSASGLPFELRGLRALSQLFYVLSKAFRWTVSAFPYTVMVFQCTVMTRHQLSRLPCTVLCCTVCRHCLGIPMPDHGFSPCTVTASPILSWPSHSAGMAFPCSFTSFPCIVLRQWFSCITKPSQSRNPYSSCTNLRISASLLPWHNLCNGTFHVEFFFSANNFPSPHSPWRKQDLLPQKHWNNAHPGNPCPSPHPTTTFQSGLGPGQGDSSSAKENKTYVRTCMQCRLCFMRAAETKFLFPSPLLSFLKCFILHWIMYIHIDVHSWASSLSKICSVIFVVPLTGILVC